jgi:predicted outer membrane repeat protein
MWFSFVLYWLPATKKSPPRGRPAPGSSRRPKRTCRPGMEMLEDRRVPATFTVTTPLDIVADADGQLSLREAITAANANPGADTIVVPAGVYKILAVMADDTNAAGDFDVTGSTLFQGAGADATVIDGQQIDRVFDVRGTAPHSIEVTFQGLTVRNGLADAGGGGGIRGTNADLVIRDSVVTGNRSAGSGGGIGFPAGSTDNLTLVRSTVSHNVAGSLNLPGGQGGGIFGPGTVTLTNSAVIRNTSAHDGGGLTTNTVNLTNSIVSGNTAIAGDGAVDAVTVNLTNSTVSGNTAFSSGGISGVTVTLTNSTVSGNTAIGGDGGGISGDTVTLTNSTVSGNTAKGNGGGIDAPTVTLTNSTVSGNTAVSANGGGIDAITLTLLNVTVTDNSAKVGGGVLLRNGGTSSVRNTIIAGNQVAFDGVNPDVAGLFTSGGHNLIGDGTGGGGFANGTKADQVGTAANPIDPRLGPLANNGGPTQTHALLAGSPAIDRGDNTLVPATDQRGGGFLRSVGGVTDIGAFEVQPPADPPPPPPPPPPQVVEIQVKQVRRRTRVDVVVEKALRRRFFPFGAFTGRVQIRRADVNGDGLLDVIARATINGKKRTRTFLT